MRGTILGLNALSLAPATSTRSLRAPLTTRLLRIDCPPKSQPEIIIAHLLTPADPAPACLVHRAQAAACVHHHAQAAAGHQSRGPRANPGLYHARQRAAADPLAAAG